MRFSVGILSSLTASFLFVTSFAAQGKEVLAEDSLKVSADVTVIESKSDCSLKVSDLYLGEYTYNKHRKEPKLRPKEDQNKKPETQITAECYSLPEDFSPPRIIITKDEDSHLEEGRLRRSLIEGMFFQSKLPYYLSLPNETKQDGNDLVIGRITEESKKETITITGEVDTDDIDEDIESGTYSDTLKIELKF